MPEYQASAMETKRSETYQNIYSNTARVGYTQWDFGIAFSLIEDTGPNKHPIIVEYASVRMSPQHFKAFIRALQTTLSAYETEHGEVLMPREPKQPSDT